MVGVIAPLVLRANYDLACTLAVVALIALGATWHDGWGLRMLWIAGVIAALIDVDLGIIDAIMKESYGKKPKLLDSNTKALRLGYRILEVPVSYNARAIADGKKIRARDGFEALWTLVKCRF